MTLWALSPPSVQGDLGRLRIHECDHLGPGPGWECAGREDYLLGYTLIARGGSVEDTEEDFIESTLDLGSEG